MKTKDRFINVWTNRINHHANAKGITLNQSMVKHNASILYNHSTHAPWNWKTHNGVWTDRTYNGPELVKITLRQYAANERYALRDLLTHIEKHEHCQRIQVWDDQLGFHRIDWIYHPEEWIGYIPHTSIQNGANTIHRANYKAITEEYKDLFAYGILEEHHSQVIVYLDRPHHDENRMMALYELLHDLDNYPLVNEDLYSDMQVHEQTEFIQGEISLFVRDLDVHKDLQFIFDTDLITKDALESHIWSLISKHNLEFDDSWIDVEEIAELSPLYQLGHSQDNKDDFRSIAYDNGKPSDQLSYS